MRALLTASASIAAMGVAAPTLAQDVDQIPDAQAADEQEDTIVITGSRIKRTGLDTVRPGLAVTSEGLDKRAFTNIADALNEIPTFGTGIDPNGAQNAFTVGQNFVDLFDLGTQRTLTLVNGRRFVSSNVPTNFGTAGGLQVDFNVLPIALVDRIDVAPLAGAAVYGSDAIAGTINVILRDDYEGFEVSGQWGTTQEGGFETWQVQTVFGANFADGRGNVAAAIEYNEQAGGLLSERPGFFSNDPNLVSFGSGAGVDVDGDGDADQEFRIFDNQVVQLFGPFGAVSPTATFIPAFGAGALADGNIYQFNPQGELETCEPGVVPGASSAFFSQGGTCGIDFFDSVAQIRSPLQRINISTLGHYDLTENVRFFAETTFSNSEASELVNQGGFQTFAFGGSSAALSGIPTSHPLLGDQARGVLEGNGLTDFAVNRFNNDLVGLGENSTENFTWRAAAGFEGGFEWAGRQFDWYAAGVFGQADVETRALGIIDGRFINALDAVVLDAAALQPIIDAGAADVDSALATFNADGQSGVTAAQLGDVVCQVNIDVAAGTDTMDFNSEASGSGISQGALPFADGCIPLNIFGDASQLNSAAALTFINGGPRITSADNEQRVFTVSLTGQVAELPAGWITLNGGFETRRERATFTPGLGTALEITRSSPFSETGGQQRTLEAFGEILIPIFNQDNAIPGFEFFEMAASVRRVDDEFESIDGTAEGSANSTSWEFGGRWSPVEDVTFRGTYTRAIRSPSLVELFAPEVQAFLFASDPCDARFVDDGLVPATRRANCVADGIDPDTFTSNVVNASIIGADAGNPDLTPEQSVAYNVGVVLSPRWIDRMSLSIDYFNITINDRIAPLNLTQVLNACYDSPSFPATPACSDELFIRDGGGQVTFGRTTNLNAASSSYQGIQSRFNWFIDVADVFGSKHLDWAGLGKWGDNDLGEIEFDATILRAIENELQVLDEEPDDPIGEFQDPKWQGTFDTTYRYGDFRFFWRTIWQDKPLFDSQFNSFISGIVPEDGDSVATLDAVIDQEQNDRLIHNMSIQYQFFDTTTVQFGVDNVFKREPTRIDFAAGNFGTAEILGRTFTFRVRSQF